MNRLASEPHFFPEMALLKWQEVPPCILYVTLLVCILKVITEVEILATEVA